MAGHPVDHAQEKPPCHGAGAPGGRIAKRMVRAGAWLDIIGLLSRKINMTPRQRLLAVITGSTPDHVPALADLSWWHAAHGGGRFVPAAVGNEKRIEALIDLHRRVGVAMHLNLGAFYREVHAPDVHVQTVVDGDRYTHRMTTPVGCVEEVRCWSPEAWSWPIVQHMVRGVEDLKIIRYVFEHVRYQACWEALARVNAMVGDIGLPFVQAPYTGMGFLISRYAGIERTVMFSVDQPDELAQTVATINAAHERVFSLLAQGPAQVLFVSDNLSSDVQSPAWFGRWSAAHYAALAKIAHAHDKPISVHIDGRLRGLLSAVSECGIDVAAAVTPAPWGYLTPTQWSDEAGAKLVLSGGVPPDSFSAAVPMTVFDARVQAWLELRHASPALVIAPGDQLPPDGELDRVRRMCDMARQATF